MITDDQIRTASLELGLTVNPPAVRCAYEWLDAQKKTKQARHLFYPYKHIIETWAGYYTSEDDVSVAIHLHPDVVGRLHAVTSARGGSGRTFFAIHLAAYLAGLPRSRVCLIDLDLPIGQAAAALGLRPPFTASDALSAGDDLEAQLPNFCVVHPNGFSVLAAPAPEDAARFSVEDAVRLVEAARRRFSHVVVDLSPATSRMAFAVLRAATDRWCLSTASLASLRTLNSVLPAFEQLDVPLSRGAQQARRPARPAGRRHRRRAPARADRRAAVVEAARPDHC